MNIIVYEDHLTNLLEPFSINHASFELQNGFYTNINRITNYYGNKAKYILIVRDSISELINDKYIEYNYD